ncbi:helix-turn-helix domain-containing protein [Pedobacter sp. N23S346]|uniref:helix-turn-helix domain-containing protein n=1 Tax=Pedobacter sp. N23S346 TaxID=3402750 RepID=UPI003AC80C36
MIKNQKQAKSTQNKLLALIEERNAYLSANGTKEKDARYLLGLNGFEGLIGDLQAQLSQYGQLTKGQFNKIQPQLHCFHETLIAARIAQNISHKQLAEMTGMKEQQIQRYESTDYEGASHNRMVEIAIALGINCSFQETWLMNESISLSFDLPGGISQKDAADLTEKVKQNGSIFIQ